MKNSSRYYTGFTDRASVRAKRGRGRLRLALLDRLEQPNESPATNRNAFETRRPSNDLCIDQILAGLVVSKMTGGSQPSALNAARKSTTCWGRSLQWTLPQGSIPPRVLYMMHDGSRMISPASPDAMLGEGEEIFQVLRDRNPHLSGSPC